MRKGADAVKQALDKYVGSAEDGGEASFDVSDLKPRKFFNDDPLVRITLAQAHQYELALKVYIFFLARLCAPCRENSPFFLPMRFGTL